MLALPAIALTAILLVMLCRGNPKRRRSARLPGEGHSATARRLLTLAAGVPGLLLALSGDAATFLIWLGGSAVMGWCIALWFGQRSWEPAD